MISLLTGQPIIGKESLIINVNGVGYGVEVNTQLLSKINHKEEVTLHIYTHVKEDQLKLFGFETAAEKELFVMMLGVSGVGPSTALNLVSLGSNTLIEAVQNAQITTFTAIPRVGKKLSQKIIIDLKGKLGEIKKLDLGPISEQEASLTDALLSLGFGEDQIHQVLSELDLENTPEEQSLKLAIKKLS
jgi:Holliday junction DNA helicase RuvA